MKNKIMGCIVAGGAGLSVLATQSALAVLPDNGVDEQTLLSDFATEWGLVAATIIGLILAFGIAWMLARKFTKIGKG